MGSQAAVLSSVTFVDQNKDIADGKFLSIDGHESGNDNQQNCYGCVLEDLHGGTRCFSAAKAGKLFYSANVTLTGRIFQLVLARNSIVCHRANTILKLFASATRPGTVDLTPESWRRYWPVQAVWCLRYSAGWQGRGLPV